MLIVEAVGFEPTSWILPYGLYIQSNPVAPDEDKKSVTDTTFFRLLSSGGDQPVELRQRLLSLVLLL